MGQMIGYLAIIIAGGTFVLAGFMILVGLIKGAIDSKNKPEVPDPLEGDPNVFSSKAQPLGRSEMTPYEHRSTKITLAFTLAAVSGMLAVLGFSAYGLKEMSKGVKTTKAMRDEAKLSKKPNAVSEEAAIEDETVQKKKKASAFDVNAKP